MKRIAALCLLAFGLVIGCHAASPSFSSFNQTYFTTNNLFISIRTNWISTNSITTLIVTNLYVTNLYSTNIIVNGTNVATLGDLIWTNDTALTPSRIRVKTGISDFYTELTNTFTRGYSADDFIFPVLALGNNTLDSDLYSAFLLLSPTNDPAQVIIRLKSPLAANNLELMCYTNAVFTGQCRLVAGSAVSGSGGTVRLNNNQDWDGINGAVIRLRYISPDWIEVGRWFAGSNSQPTTITINPTDNYVPARTSANSFGDSPMHVPAAGSTNAIFDGAIYVGPNSYGFWGASDYSIVSIHDIDQDEPNNNGIAIWTVSGNLNGAIDGNVTTNIAVLSVGVANSNVGSSVVWTGAQTNLFLDGQFGTNNPSVFKLHPTVEDISANAAYTLDTPTWQLKTAADLLRIKNAGTNMLAVGPTGQIIFGPGTTNLLYRSGSDFVLENDDTTGFELLLKDVSGSASYGVNGNGAPKITSTVVGQPVILNAGGESDGLTVTTTSLQPGTETMAIGANSSNGAWVEQYFKGTLRQQGVNDGAGNRTLLEITHRGNAGDIELKSNAAGTQTFRPIAVMVGSTNVAKFDTTSAAGETRFWLYDEDNGTMERVTVGIPDSGGAGYKLLRIPN